MRTLDTKTIEDEIYRLAMDAGVSLTDGCKEAMYAAAEAEDEGAAKFALGALCRNFELAESERVPVCQDTGMAIVMLEIGQEVYLSGKPLAAAVNDGVRRAYADGYFRKSVCDPLTRVNTGDNTPAVIHTEIVEGDKVRITYMPKGFGSENMSRVYMLKPAQGADGIVDAIVETVRLAGSRPCPPVICGVGIGGSFDTCTLLAKRALARGVGTESDRADVRDIERRALERINALGIGCQGFGGKVTALAVNCMWAPTHIAGLPVAINIQCHCMRAGESTL